MCIRDSYRSPLNFSDDLMESAKNGLERIITSGAKIRDIISNGKDGKVTDAEAKLLDESKEYITNSNTAEIAFAAVAYTHLIGGHFVKFLI